uniref:Elongation factor Ts, mitochondrial n=1 Tax=Cryptomonas sp. CCAC 1634B TaxID=2051848 RepID=A0A679C9P0_9CRYP|nr:translation elongation factor Ts [Cryptomonas sp. CCAC 1634B]
MTTNISAQAVKELRKKTSAGMMDCKQALQDSCGSIPKAIEILKQKGLVIAEKKVHRAVAEGCIECYIHVGGKLGVMVEVNCETDFVARRLEFKEFARNIAMQIAASPLVKFISMQDIPKEFVGEQSLSNENMCNKRNLETVLMEQPFIKDPSLTVGELVTQHITLWGENIRIRRFERFLLGGSDL